MPGDFFRRPVRWVMPRPERLASPKPFHLVAMKGEPTAQCVIKVVDLTPAEQTTISGLAFQCAAR